MAGCSGVRGFESSESVEFTTIHVDSRTNDLTRVDVSAREVVAFGPMKTGDFGSVEDALARAIAQASVVDIAGAHTLHEAIGRLLGDERAIRADVIDLNEKRRP